MTWPADALLFHDDAGLPRPDWGAISHDLEGIADDDERHTAWSVAARSWLETLAEALETPHEVHEGPSVLLLMPTETHAAAAMLGVAERSVRELHRRLPGITRFRSPGKLVIVGLEDQERYVDYISRFYDDGHYGASTGVQIRNDDYPHIALWMSDPTESACTIAHECVHLALVDRDLPQWVEEGLAQMFEGDMVASRRRIVTAEDKAKHLRLWKRRGLDMFWTGAAFSAPDKMQDAAYELAEVLIRNLAADFRPRFFGFDRRPVERFLSFLRSARTDDAGAAAAIAHLDRDLGAIATSYLGPGDWAQPAEWSAP